MKISEMTERGRNPTLSLEELPDLFLGTLIKEELKSDSFGKEALFWNIEFGEGLVIQKFLPLHLKVLSEQLEKLGIKDTDELIGAKVEFQKTEFVVGKNRWIPLKVVKQKKL